MRTEYAWKIEIWFAIASFSVASLFFSYSTHGTVRERDVQRAMINKKNRWKWRLTFYSSNLSMACQIRFHQEFCREYAVYYTRRVSHSICNIFMAVCRNPSNAGKLFSRVSAIPGNRKTELFRHNNVWISIQLFLNYVANWSRIFILWFNRSFSRTILQAAQECDARARARTRE